jgi:hypothetical protein
MIENDLDETAFEKILEAAERIADMARTRPADAPSLLERARYLRSLAEDIRRDWERRFAMNGNAPPCPGASDEAPGQEAALLLHATV